jgi:hypothetical protein
MNVTPHAANRRSAPVAARRVHGPKAMPQAQVLLPKSHSRSAPRALRSDQVDDRYPHQRIRIDRCVLRPALGVIDNSRVRGGKRRTLTELEKREVTRLYSETTTPLPRSDCGSASLNPPSIGCSNSVALRCVEELRELKRRPLQPSRQQMEAYVRVDGRGDAWVRELSAQATPDQPAPRGQFQADTVSPGNRRRRTSSACISCQRPVWHRVPGHICPRSTRTRTGHPRCHSPGAEIRCNRDPPGRASRLRRAGQASMKTSTEHHPVCSAPGPHDISTVDRDVPASAVAPPCPTRSAVDTPVGLTTAGTAVRPSTEVEGRWGAFGTADAVGVHPVTAQRNNAEYLPETLNVDLVEFTSVDIDAGVPARGVCTQHSTGPPLVAATTVLVASVVATATAAAKNRS